MFNGLFIVNKHSLHFEFQYNSIVDFKFFNISLLTEILLRTISVAREIRVILLNIVDH